MPPWNMPGRKINVGDRAYFDGLPESSYELSQVALCVWCHAHLVKGGQVVYHHQNRRVRGRLISPLAWLSAKERHRLVVQEEVVIAKGNSNNYGKHFLLPTTERLWVLRRIEDSPSDCYSEAKPDALSERCGNSTHDLWRFSGRIHGAPHSAVMLPEMAYRIIQKWSRPGALVCDPYLGTGTTMLAAHQLGRSFVGAEIKLAFFKIAQRSLEKLNRTYAHQSNRHKS